MDDETRAFLRHLFDRSDDTPPQDVVPTGKATPAEMREHYLHMNEIAGTWVKITIPGEVLLDPDGMPIGVGPSRVENAYHGGAGVMRYQLEDVGLTPKDVPKLHIIDAPRRLRDRSEGDQ